MTSIYSGKCDNCGYETNHVSEAQACIRLDSPTDTVFTDPDDKRFILLLHPLEDHALSETGHTLRSASREGRYFVELAYFCRSCGNPYFVRKLSTTGGHMGCFLLLIAVAVWAWIGSKVSTSWGFWILLALSVPSFMVLSATYWAARRRWLYHRHADIVRQLLL